VRSTALSWNSPWARSDGDAIALTAVSPFMNREDERMLRTFLIAACGYGTLVLACPVLGGVIVTIDEQGVGSIRSTTGMSAPMQGVLGVDSDGHPTLIYTPPPAFNFKPLDGDLYLHEPGTPTGTFSDVVRFHGGTICFYSDQADPGETATLGDVGIPVHLLDNKKTIEEIGPENANGATYVPLMGEPGFDPGQTVSVIVISDVPEPASLGFATLSTLFLVGFVSRVGKTLRKFVSNQ
jgi:hypothetical protein